LAKTKIAGDETQNFQKAVAGEAELRGKTLVEYNSAEGTKRFRYLYNQDTVSKAAGIPVCYVFSNTSYRDAAVDQPATGRLACFAGVFAESVTSGAWGWVQTWGYNSAVPCRRHGSVTEANGVAGDWVSASLNGIDALTTIDDTNSGADSGPAHATMTAAHAVRIASIASTDSSSSTSNQAVFIRGLIP
jgi:hypothetical protein